MTRLIEVRVHGDRLTKGSSLAGIQHEANANSLHIEFDESWDGYAKTVTFWNALGENPVKIILAADMLDDISDSHIYTVPIPGEAMAVSGRLTFIVDGYVDDKRQRSVSTQLSVEAAPIADDAGEPEPITPSVAEQLQREIEGILPVIQADKEAAVDAATRAEESAEAAATSAEEAALSESNAAESEASASDAATRAAASEGAALSYKDAAESAMQAANTSATNASASEVNAAAAKEMAVSAGNVARAAASDAEEAKDAAESANTSAQAAKSAAQTAQAGAEAAQAEAENARDIAVSAKDVAVAAKDVAVQYSGNPAKPINGNWHIWNAETQAYEDSGMPYVKTYDKTYASVSAMNADFANMPVGSLVMIASNTEEVDNSKIYTKTASENSWHYLGDLSGLTGVGVASVTRVSGNHAPGTFDTYRMTLTDGRTTDIQVYNGANGEGSGDMLSTIYDPAGGNRQVAFADEIPSIAGLATETYVDDAISNNKNVFIAVFNQTTNKEVFDAYQAGKTIFVRYDRGRDERIYAPLLRVETQGSDRMIFLFSCLYGGRSEDQTKYLFELTYIQGDDIPDWNQEEEDIATSDDVFWLGQRKQDVISDLATIRAGAAKGATALQEHQDISGKQDVISDLATIRSGASKGATALQSVPSTYRTAAQQDAIHDSTKQDVISDLATIRSGASAGATALQSVPSTYRTAAEQDAIHDVTKQDVLTAGDNITIENNVISAAGESYTAGAGISIENGVISCTFADGNEVSY